MTLARKLFVPAVLAVITVASLTASVAPAQSRLQRRRTQPRTAVNAAHEKLKTEADQAYRKGDFKRTVELTSSVIRENPSDHVAYYLRGSARAEIAVRNRDVKEMRGAIADSREAIRLDGTRNPMYYMPYLYGMTNLTMLENRKEHAEVAVKVAGQVLSLPTLKGDDRANLYYQRGNSQLALAKYAEAANDFLSALRFSPSHLGARLAAADAYGRAGQPDKAKEQFDAAVKAFPENPLVFNNRGMFLQQQGKLSEAIVDFTQAIEINKNYLYAYTNRGFCLLQEGNPKSAEADFSRSLQINKSQPAVYSQRASARMNQNNLVGALADNRAALQLDAKNPTAQADLAFTLFFTGKYENALQAFEAAYKLDTNQRHLNPWRFLCREVLGKKDDALKTFATDLAKPTAKRDWVDALTAYLAGKLDAAGLVAAVSTQSAEIKAAQTCEAHFFIGIRAQIAGDTKTALSHYKQAVATKQKHLSAYHGSRLAIRKLLSLIHI